VLVRPEQRNAEYRRRTVCSPSGSLSLEGSAAFGVSIQVGHRARRAVLGTSSIMGST
jgi:hypothetical protein